jgi:hypothetical protein
VVLALLAAPLSGAATADGAATLAVPDGELFDTTEVAVAPPASVGSLSIDASQETGPAVGGNQVWPVGATTQVNFTTDGEFVMLLWDGDPEATFRLRTLGEDGWSEAVDLEAPEVVEGPDPGVEGPATPVMASPPVWGGWGVTAAEITVTGGAPHSVRAELQRSRYDRPGEPETMTALGIDPSVSTQAPGLSIPVITRSQWGAQGWAWGNPNCSRGPVRSAAVDLIVVHHTASNNTYTAATAANQVRNIQNWHRNTLKWCDIAYNFLIDRFGRVYEGRSGSLTSAVRGSHASNYNTRTMGIAMIGQFHPGPSPAGNGTPVPRALVDGTRSLIRALAVRWSLDTQGSTIYNSSGTNRRVPVVVAHRDVNSTTCPGNFGYAHMGEFRTAGAGAVRPPVCSFRDAPVGDYFSEAACWLAARNITTGWSGDTTTFAPHLDVDRAQMAAFLWRAAERPDAPTRCGFADVPTGRYYEQATCWLTAHNSTPGWDGNEARYNPQPTVTRDQMAAFLWRAAGEPAAPTRCGFADVPAGSYYERATCWLKANNITTGWNGNPAVFAPREPVSRAQMAAFLWRNAGQPSMLASVGG